MPIRRRMSHATFSIQRLASGGTATDTPRTEAGADAFPVGYARLTVLSGATRLRRAFLDRPTEWLQFFPNLLVERYPGNANDPLRVNPHLLDLKRLS